MKDTFAFDKINQVVSCRTCIKDAEFNFLDFLEKKQKQQNMAGVFSAQGVENEKERVQSRPLRHLKEALVAHFSKATHQHNDAVRKEEMRIQKETANRNRVIGRKVGSLAYFFFYHKLPYLLFEKFLPLFSLNNIDIGQVNHSEQFLRRLVDPCSQSFRRDSAIT